MNTLINITFNNDVTYAFSIEILRKIPYFDDIINNITTSTTGAASHAITTCNVVCPLMVHCSHLVLLAKIMKPQKVIAGLDATSHKVVFGVMQLAKFLGIPTEVVNSGFGLWTAGANWINMRGLGYIYVIYAKNNYLCDINKFFREHPAPMEALTEGLKRKDINTIASEYLAMLEFFETIDFVDCFNANNDTIQDRIKVLNNMRLEAWSCFLVNPHSELIAPTMHYTPVITKVWDCKNITIMQPYKVDEPVMVSLDVVLARFKEFTYGVFEKPLNHLVKTPFPFDNAVFAGGSITKIISANYDIRKCKQSDIDIFVIGENNCKQAQIVDEILNWFNTTNDPTGPQSYFAINGSVTTVYICDIKRKFQIISMNSNNPHKIIGRFDFSHVQWCIYKGQVLGTAASCNAIRAQTTKIVNVARIKLIRVIKAFHCGYDVVCNDVITNICGEIDILLQTPNSNTMQTILAELYVWYYPISDHTSTPAGDRAHILCQINKDSSYRLVTDDFNSALANVTIGGNFNIGYEDNLYSTFNANNIVNCIVGRYINYVTVQNKKGIMRLQTPSLTVVSIRNNEEGAVLGVVTTEPKFIAFCNNLDTNVFRMYKGTNVIKNLVNNEIITFNVSKSAIALQLTRGVSILRTYKGQPLDIEEDLYIGDEIVITFSITMMLNADSRSVVLSVSKIMKKDNILIQLPASGPATSDGELAPNPTNGVIAYDSD